MRLVKRLLLLGLLLAATLPLGSCGRAVERARERIRLEAVESVRRLGFSGAEAVVRVRNDSRGRLVLREADLEFFLGGRPVLSARLHRQVEVPRRTTERVVTRWRLQILDPMALPVLTGRLRAGEIGQVAVSCRIRGRGGPVRVNISQEMMPLSDFLNIFGLTLQDVQNYL